MITNPEEVISNNKISNKQNRLKQWLKKPLPNFVQISWQIWTMILIAISGGLSFTAFSSLFLLPKNSNCTNIFWPIASASMRLYCAQLDAEQGTVDSILQAIELVEALPPDHPLRSEINRSLNEWSEDLLNLAEKEVQAGRINQAIDIAMKIPSYSQADQNVAIKIERWRAIWQTGNGYLEEIDKQLHASNWDQAFRAAIQILNIKNQYWSTVEYSKAIKKVQLAREHSNLLALAVGLSKEGGLDNWIKSINKILLIPEDSYAYKDAQSLIQTNKEHIVNLVYKIIQQRNWTKLTSVVEQIGELPLFQKNLVTWQIFVDAFDNTIIDTPEGFQNAVIILAKIEATDPLYGEAQNLIERYSLEAEDLVYINKSKELAKLGTINDYHKAIAELEQIPETNPRYQMALQMIAQWENAIETIEDQPILNRAEMIAGAGKDTLSLEEAISQVRTIASNRALYKEAQNHIAKWQAQIETIEDQPILDRAISLAGTKDYTMAIETAKQIFSDRPLYKEAKQKIKHWRREIWASNTLDSAYQVAESKTPDNLSKAINLVEDIPSSTDVSSQAQEAINLWSNQLLNMAKDKADIASYQEAIRIAKLIPPKTDVYSTAQSEIEDWRKVQYPSNSVDIPTQSHTP